MKIDALTVFFPLHNEEENVENTVSKALKILEGQRLKDFEVLLINDGSTDKTGKIINNLQKKNSRLKVITHKVNQGYGGALKSGFYGAKYPWIAFTDADGQFDFSEIESFIGTQEKTNADLVIGYYKERKVSTFTILTSKAWEVLVFILFGLRVKDIDCGFKLINKKVIDKIPKLESEKGAFISSELLIKAQKEKFKIVEIPVNHFPRVAGTSTGRKLNVIIKSFIDLFKLWWKLR